MASTDIRLSEKDHAVLDELNGSMGVPLSAYDLVKRLSGAGIRYPVTVYRSLDKLIAGGLAHRIESSNAFVACSGCHANDQPLFALCRTCGSATEVQMRNAAKLFEAAASKLGFHITDMNLELKGVCAACAASNEQDR
ncbi:MAG: transcriptional repressor [Pseudomonadota bacterium]